MKLKDIAKNALWFGIFPRLSILASLFVTPLITPYLTQSDYGIWGIISAYVGLITGFATLGLHVHLTNSYYEYKTRFASVWRRLIFWMCIGSLICFFITMFLLYKELPNTAPYNRYLIILLAALPVALNYNAIIAQHYYGIRLLPKPMVIRKLIGTFCGVSALFISVYYFRVGYLGLILSPLISGVVIFILFIRPLWFQLKIYPYPNRLNKRTAKWFKLAAPMIPHNVGHILLGSSSRIVMAAVAIPTAQIGIYTNGFTFGEYASIIILAVISALSPVIQTTFRNGNHKQMFKIFLFTETVTLIIICGLSIWMREVYQILVRNESLQIAHTVASYTCFSMAMFPLYTMLVTTATIEKKTLKILWLIFVPAMLCLVLNFIFVPIYGYRAAIFVTVISYWSISIISLLVPYYRNNMKNWLGNPFKILFLPLICTLLLIGCQYLGRVDLNTKIIFTALFLIIAAVCIIRYRQKIFNFGFEHQDII